MSEVKVNKISPRTNCGTTTLGDSGDIFTIPAGVSITNNGTASGFGSTGEVSWNTTVKTSTFTVTAGEGFFCNTTGGAFTANLPAGTAGSSFAIADYAATFQTNNLTVSPNGSQKIGGISGDVALGTEGQSAYFVYIDDTQGWVNVIDSTSNVRASEFPSATGGTITTSGNYKIHTFTGPGTFTVCGVGGTAANNIVSYMVVAGGAGGGGRHAGGGGAGGFREYKGPADSYTASPLNGNPGGTAVTVTAQAYPITVGAGGGGGNFAPGSATSGSKGNNSVFSTITSAGGGGGMTADSAAPATPVTHADGGSGGGGAYEGWSQVPGKSPNPIGGSGNSPPVSPSQGNNGGTAQAVAPYAGAGGGGATAVGVNAAPGTGGAGATTSITASPVAYAGGGGGGSYVPGGAAGAGGTGGGGAGGPSGGQGSAGTANTGGGGGGTGNQQAGSPASTQPQDGGAGGSGIVVIRYKFQ
jgi:hypothetical protein